MKKLNETKILGIDFIHWTKSVFSEEDRHWTLEIQIVTSFTYWLIAQMFFSLMSDFVNENTYKNVLMAFIFIFFLFFILDKVKTNFQLL